MLSDAFIISIVIAVYALAGLLLWLDHRTNKRKGE
jgi:hypothetical protein